MSIGQAKERAEIALEIVKTRREREAALHRQLASHIQRLKEAHAQISAGTHPSPPELTTATSGSPQRVRHRSQAPPESPGPAQAQGAEESE